MKDKPKNKEQALIGTLQMANGYLDDFNKPY